MKRRAMKLVLFLLAGAIINVAVAWGCALWCVEFGMQVVQPPEERIIEERWRNVASDGWPPAPIEMKLDQRADGSSFMSGVTYQRHFGGESLFLIMATTGPQGATDYEWSTWYIACGWPLRCFCGDL